MKKLIYFSYILILSVILAIIFEYKPFMGSFYTFVGGIDYKLNKLNYSLNLFEKSINFLNDKNITFYNIGNTYYKKNDFKNSIIEYNKITSSGSVLSFNKFHNLGNSYYRLGEKTKNDEEKTLFWSNSINSYKKALDINIEVNKNETQKNYQFVLDKLKKLEQNKVNQQQNNTGSGQIDNNKSQSGSQQSSTGSSNDEKTWTNSSQGFKDFQNQDKKNGLSEIEKQELEKYSQYLKDFQKQNQDFIQKGPTNSNSFEDMVNRFFRGDPNFDSTLPDNSNGGRDW